MCVNHMSGYRCLQAQHYYFFLKAGTFALRDFCIGWGVCGAVKDFTARKSVIISRDFNFSRVFEFCQPHFKGLLFLGIDNRNPAVEL